MHSDASNDRKEKANGQRCTEWDNLITHLSGLGTIVTCTGTPGRILEVLALNSLQNAIMLMPACKQHHNPLGQYNYGWRVKRVADRWSWSSWKHKVGSLRCEKWKRGVCATDEPRGPSVCPIEGEGLALAAGTINRNLPKLFIATSALSLSLQRENCRSVHDAVDEKRCGETCETGGKKNLLNFHSARRCNASFACQLDGHQEIMRTNEPQGREDLIFLLLSLPSPNKQQKTGSGEAADGLALVVHASRLRELRGKWIKYEGKRVYLLHLLVPLLSTTTQTYQSILHAVRRLRVKLVLGGQKVEI